MIARACVCGALLGVASCVSSDPQPIQVFTDAAPAALVSIPLSGDAGTVQSFPLSGPGDPGAGAVYVTISGEANAITGYPFPPSSWTNGTYMVDGWEIRIDEFLVVVDHVALWANPNESASDPSLHGSQVAHLDGPFVVDLHKGGSIVGQGGFPEEATALGVIANQNDSGGAPFDPTVTYGFGFQTVPATYSGINVNLTADEAADFAAMVAKGYSVFYRGTATWKGSQSTYGCTVAGEPADGLDAAAGSAGYDYTSWPTTMTFALGFSTPTSYVNCQNQSLHEMPIGGQDYPRGIQVSSSQSAIAQLTVHMDHPFWESFAENSPVHWDQVAAQYAGVGGKPEVHVEDLIGVPFYAFTDKRGSAIPWRNCAGPYYTPPGRGQMAFSTLAVPVNPKASCTGPDGGAGVDFTQDACPAIRDYHDYMRFTQSTQGHLNSQGLCVIDRKYPAPAGGS
jgi:hypothetical protein